MVLGDLEAEWKGWWWEIFREWRKERVCKIDKGCKGWRTGGFGRF